MIDDDYSYVSATRTKFEESLLKVSCGEMAVISEGRGSEEGRPMSELLENIITFELIQHIRPLYINVTGSQTDIQTDGRTDDLRWYN